MKRKVYGVASKYEFWRWNHDVYVFDTKEEAEEWLYSKEYDFREREIMTKNSCNQISREKSCF